MISRFVIILCLSLSGMSFTQKDWTFVSDNETINDTIFDLRQKYKDPRCCFKFYCEDKFRNEKSGCTEIKRVDKNHRLIIDLPHPIIINQYNLSYYIYVYTENIISYSVKLQSDRSDSQIGILNNIYKDGYQYPWVRGFVDGDDTRQHDLAKSTQDSIKHKKLGINRIIIDAESRDEHPSKFIIGDFLLLDVAMHSEKIIHPILNANNQDYSRKISVENLPILYPWITYTNVTRSDWHVRLNDNRDTVQEKKALKEIFGLCLKHYPFYKARAISKDSVATLYNTIISDTTLSTNVLYGEFKKICQIFNDGHFDILGYNPKTTRQSSPVRIAEFNRNYYVSAVFLEGDYSEMVGCRIKAIDNIEIDHLIANIKKDKKITYEQLVNRYINKPIMDSTNYCLELCNGRDTSICIKHSDKIFVAANFKPVHQKFKIVGDNTAYFRLNNFIPGDYLAFMSHLNAIKSAKGLIFDLRGNGGGNSLVAMQIFSSFIHKPSVYNYELDFYNNKRTVVVKPCKNDNYIDKPILILVDENTACCSECFASAMRKQVGAIIVGASNTKGAYSSLTEMLFPSGILLKTNAFSDRLYDAGGQEIETIGISPDIFIDIGAVKELYPYKDKCLQESIQLIEY